MFYTERKARRLKMISRKTGLLNIKNKLRSGSQNWERFEQLWNSNKPISFYNWECPPRQKAKDKNGTWINFDIDIEAVVGGKKLDEFTEFPRLTSQVENERWFLELVNSRANTNYTKIIADTNALYINPKSIKILGDKKIAKLSLRFKKALEQTRNALLKAKSPKIILYTDLKKGFAKEYDLFFNLIYQSFNNTGSPFVPNNIYKHWVNRVTEHVGLTEKEKAEKYDAVRRSISTYAAEGMIFNLLNQSGLMPNPVWANFEEPPENGQSTEILRVRYGIASLPILYFFKEDYNHG